MINMTVSLWKEAFDCELAPLCLALLANIRNNISWPIVVCSLCVIVGKFFETNSLIFFLNTVQNLT